MNVYKYFITVYKIQSFYWLVFSSVLAIPPYPLTFIKHLLRIGHHTRHWDCKESQILTYRSLPQLNLLNVLLFFLR